jgi:hypothetical protein
LHLAIAATRRISEKNAAFLTHFDHNGWCHRFEVPASSKASRIRDTKASNGTTFRNGALA